MFAPIDIFSCRKVAARVVIPTPQQGLACIKKETLTQRRMRGDVHVRCGPGAIPE